MKRNSSIIFALAACNAVTGAIASFEVNRILLDELGVLHLHLRLSRIQYGVAHCSDSLGLLRKLRISVFREQKSSDIALRLIHSTFFAQIPESIL